MDVQNFMGGGGNSRQKICRLLIAVINEELKFRFSFFSFSDMYGYNISKIKASVYIS